MVQNTPITITDRLAEARHDDDLEYLPESESKPTTKDLESIPKYSIRKRLQHLLNLENNVTLFKTLMANITQISREYIEPSQSFGRQQDRIVKLSKRLQDEYPDIYGDNSSSSKLVAEYTMTYLRTIPLKVDRRKWMASSQTSHNKRRRSSSISLAEFQRKKVARLRSNTLAETPSNKENHLPRSLNFKPFVGTSNRSPNRTALGQQTSKLETFNLSQSSRLSAESMALTDVVLSANTATEYNSRSPSPLMRFRNDLPNMPFVSHRRAKNGRSASTYLGNGHTVGQLQTLGKGRELSVHYPSRSEDKKQFRCSSTTTSRTLRTSTPTSSTSKKSQSTRTWTDDRSSTATYEWEEQGILPLTASCSSSTQSSQRNPFGASFDTIYNFLRNCEPPMTHYHETFVNFGLTEKYIRGMKKWKPQQISEFLAKIPCVSNHGTQMPDIDIIFLANHVVNYTFNN